jgi:hypothetical protein
VTAVLFVLRFERAALLVDIMSLTLDLHALLRYFVGLAFERNPVLFVCFGLLLRADIVEATPARMLDCFPLRFELSGFPSERYLLGSLLFGLLMKLLLLRL